ncbi:MAG: glycosyltransferase [Candidatus Levyibacteriota bacterium]
MKKKQKRLSVSICIPAYNEGKNIKKLLHALSMQVTKYVEIKKIIVVCSGCTDKTENCVKAFAKANKKIILITEKQRNGKASAINRFLKIAHEEIVVIESADTIPEKDTIEKLCIPFLKDKSIGMTGGAPIPVNDPNTFLGYIIHSWWWFHRNIPRFGEIIAYRNILPQISMKTAVDEAYIQAKLVKKGYKPVHIDEARVKNKGPETVADLIKQRRRIYNGHARLHAQEHVKIDNMTKSSVYLILYKYKIHNIKQLFWLIGGIGLELYARFLGFYDTVIKHKNPYIWDTAKTTKRLDIGLKGGKVKK